LGFQGVVLTLILTSLTSIPQELYNNFKLTNIIPLFLLLSSISFLLYAFGKSLWTIFPRLGKNNKSKSLLYFHDIAKYQFQEYKKAMKNLSEADYADALIEQIYVSAKIASTKHKHFRDSLILFAIGFAMLLITYIFLFIRIFYG
jgi:Family of unknown function (DUF5706)